MASLKDVIYISNEDYETLVSTGTVTIDGETLTYDENNIYITPDKLASAAEDGLMSAADKTSLDTIKSAYLKNATVANNTLTITKQDDTIVTFQGGNTDTNQTVKTSSVTFGNDDAIQFNGGGNITITGDASAKTMTLGVASGYSIPSTADQTTWSGKQDALPTTSTAGKVLKSTSTAGTVQWSDDINTWRSIQVDSTEKLGTDTSTGALNFISQNTNYGDVSFTYNGGIKATAKMPTVNDGTLTITLNGTVSTFTANQSNDISVSIVTPQIEDWRN